MPTVDFSRRRLARRDGFQSHPSCLPPRVKPTNPKPWSTARADVGGMLFHLRGAPPHKVLYEVRRRLFPLRWRMVDLALIVLFREGFHPEWELIREVAKCSSAAQVAEAFTRYESHPMRPSRATRRLLGRPRLRRALSFYCRLKLEWLSAQQRQQRRDVAA
jgi:hypothetical protein